MKKQSISWKTFSAPIIALLLVCVAGMAEAKPSFGSNCLLCHSTTGGNMNIFPDPVEIVVGSSETITFDITSIPNGKAAVAVSDLDALFAGNYIVGAGWTAYSGYYASDFIEATGPVTMELWIGAAVTPGDYGLGAILAGGSADWGMSKNFTVRVVAVPEPPTLDIVSVVGGIVHLSWSPAGNYTLQYSGSPGFDVVIDTAGVGDTVTGYDYNVGTATKGFFRLVSM